MQENDLAIIKHKQYGITRSKTLQRKKGKEYVKSLCLLGNNDDFDEIVVEDDGTMTVTTVEDMFNNGTKEFEPVRLIYKGITRIKFK